MTNPSERDSLLHYFSNQRQHILQSLAGVDAVDLRRPVLPSGWNCLGLVQHLALDVERFWFQGVVAGDAEAIAYFATNPGSAWEVAPDLSAEAIFDLYRQETARSDEIIRATEPDGPLAWWPGDLFGDFRLQNVRQIILHAMTETATHAGHLDAARELIDGKLWLVLA